MDALFREFRVRGIEASNPPNNELGFRIMTITDPNTNQLRLLAMSRN